MPNNFESSVYPTGPVTFLFTDLEDSSRLWDQYPEQMKATLGQHDAILRDGVEANQGVIVKTTGDGLHAAFASPGDALQATLDCQHALLAHNWPSTGRLRVRMGLHTGQAQLREGDYYGPAVNRAARVMSVAGGGQVLLSMVTAELVRDELPVSVSLVDLGQHRLRSLDRPERLFQLEHPSLQADFPPLKSIRTTPNNLPIQLTSFIGRKTETAQVREMLTPKVEKGVQDLSGENDPLITLTGPGGTGKTRLSLQVAADILDAYPDGVWLVELAPLANPELVVQAVAEPLGLREQAGQPLESMLVNYLRPRRVLLVLDNCEHVIDACAQLADTLLRSCPDLRILASSREALGIAGERPVRVRSLSLPADDMPISEGELAEYDAIQLFETRAKTAKNSFTLTEANAAVLVQICRRLDGIPLAIELAAARVRVLSPEQILDRLDNRFRLLTGGSRTALPRQRTLLALIDWSYDLLSEEECVLLRRLSVFSGGWTMEAAEVVTGTDPLEPFEILDLLEQLHNKSMILATDGDLGVRYHILETIRQYAQEKLSQSSEANHFRDRHLAYFVEQSEEGGRAMSALRSGDWVEQLVAENENLRAARAWALENDINSSLRMMASLTARWSIIFSATEALQFLERLFEKIKTSTEYTNPKASEENKVLYGRALVNAGNLAMGLGLETAADYALRGASIAREYGDMAYLANALVIAGATNSTRGRDDLARQNHQELFVFIHELEPGMVKAMVLTSFGLVFAVNTGDDIEQAWENWEYGMSMFRQGGDLWGLAYGHGMAAVASKFGGELEKTFYHAQRSLTLFNEVGDTHMVNIAQSLLADVARNRGDWHEAAVHYVEAASGWRKVDQYGAMARCLECLAFVENNRAQVTGEGLRAQYLSRSAILMGAAAIIRQTQNTPMPPAEQTEYEQELALIKEAAGQGLFQDGWQLGQAMDPDQAITYVQDLAD